MTLIPVILSKVMAALKTPICKYWPNCYQKNEKHKKAFRHPEVEEKKLEAEPKDAESDRKRRKIDEQDHSPLNSSNEDLKPAGPSEELDNVRSPEAPVEIPPLDTLESKKDFIKEVFLVDMPDDFYDLWSVAKSLNSEHPSAAFECAGFTLIGPYDILASKIEQTKKLTKSDFLTHCRYFYDPPEFQTVLKGDDDEQLHIGYYRDDPSSTATIVCSNSVEQGCQFQIVGDNIFAPIHSALKKAEKQAKSKEDKEKLAETLDQLEKVAKKKSHSLEAATKKISSRKKKVVCTPFHGIGLVVPFENNIGYREIPETNGNLRRMLNAIADATEPSLREKKMESLQELITFVQFANDECDPGMGLELGIDLFSSGHKCFHKEIYNLLSVAYMLLNRSEFSEILEAHLANRRRGADLSNF